jgi:hypothetical protein
LALQGTIREALVVLEPLQDLGQHVFEGHGASSACQCAPRCFRPPVHRTIHTAVAPWRAGTRAFAAVEARRNVRYTMPPMVGTPPAQVPQRCAGDHVAGAKIGRSVARRGSMALPQGECVATCASAASVLRRPNRPFAGDQLLGSECGCCLFDVRWPCIIND